MSQNEDLRELSRIAAEMATSIETALHRIRHEINRHNGAGLHVEMWRKGAGDALKLMLPAQESLRRYEKWFSERMLQGVVSDEERAALIRKPPTRSESEVA